MSWDQRRYGEKSISVYVMEQMRQLSFATCTFQSPWKKICILSGSPLCASSCLVYCNGAAVYLRWSVSICLFLRSFIHSLLLFSSSQAVWLLQIFCFLSLVTATSCHIADPQASTAVLRKHILSRNHLFFWTSCHWRKIFILTSSGHRACRYKLWQFLIFSLLSSTLLQGTTFALKSDFWLTSEVLLILSW